MFSCRDWSVKISEGKLCFCQQTKGAQGQRDLEWLHCRNASVIIQSWVPTEVRFNGAKFGGRPGHLGSQERQQSSIRVVPLWWVIVMVVMMCMSCGMVVRITVTCYLVKICPHQWEFLLPRNISYSSAHCQKRVILHFSYFVILIFILRGLCAFTIESMSLQRHFNLVSNCAVGESWWDKDSTLVYTPQILFLFLRKPFTCLEFLKNFRWLFFWQLI